jgi:hypothetical protein
MVVAERYTEGRININQKDFFFNSKLFVGHVLL